MLLLGMGGEDDEKDGSARDKKRKEEREIEGEGDRVGFLKRLRRERSEERDKVAREREKGGERERRSDLLTL